MPDVPSSERSMHDGRVLVPTSEPVRATQAITTWALEDDVDLGHFSVAQPTLEDIYLELTGAESPATQTETSTPTQEVAR